MAKLDKKKIIVKSRGKVLTSRGMCITPIQRPYYEKINQILLMISRYRADVYEILETGEEVKLTAQNFDKDNSIKMTDAVNNKPFTVPDRDLIKQEHDAENEALKNAEISPEETQPVVSVEDNKGEELVEGEPSETVTEDVKEISTPEEVNSVETEEQTETQPVVEPEKPLSRKERRRLNAEKREREKTQESTEVPTDAIED